jgi:hypothetical protein
MGGLGRSRGRKAKFQANNVIGLYEDPDFEVGIDIEVDIDDGETEQNDGQKRRDSQGSNKAIRRRGTVHFTAREVSWL